MHVSQALINVRFISLAHHLSIEASPTPTMLSMQMMYNVSVELV
jgi:hypothetical protein